MSTEFPRSQVTQEERIVRHDRKGERNKEKGKVVVLLRGFRKNFHHFSFHLLNQFAWLEPGRV